MAEQVQRPRTNQRKEEKQVRDLPQPQEKSEKLKEELDDLLDEIDGVLETNAEEFVKAYVQKGGQ